MDDGRQYGPAPWAGPTPLQAWEPVRSPVGRDLALVRPRPVSGPVTGQLPLANLPTERTRTQTRGPAPRSRSTTVGPQARYHRRPARGRRARTAIVLAFWLGLAASVSFWWFDTPVASVDSLGGALIEAGRITGMVAGYILVVQVLMMSRVGWLDRTISANNLLGAHRDLGLALIVMVLLHAALIIVGYASASGETWTDETTTMLMSFEDMISAFVATGILVGVGLLAIRGIRALMPYELWHFLHLSTYLVLLLSYGHQFAMGRDLASGGLATQLWAGGHPFVLALVLRGRGLHPFLFNLRHRLRVAEGVDQGADMFSLYLE